MDYTTPKVPPQLRQRPRSSGLRRIVREGYNSRNEYVRMFDDGSSEVSQPELPDNQLGEVDLTDEPRIFDNSQSQASEKPKSGGVRGVRRRRETGEDGEVNTVEPSAKKVAFDEKASESSLVDLTPENGIIAESEEEKPEYERVVDGEVVEMKPYLIPGECLKENIRKNYLWKFGRADGQFRVVLGHNTVFKVYNFNE